MFPKQFVNYAFSRMMKSCHSNSDSSSLALTSLLIMRESWGPRMFTEFLMALKNTFSWIIKKMQHKFGKKLGINNSDLVNMFCRKRGILAFNGRIYGRILWLKKRYSQKIKILHRWWKTYNQLCRSNRL